MLALLSGRRLNGESSVRRIRTQLGPPSRDKGKATANAGMPTTRLRSTLHTKTHEEVSKSTCSPCGSARRAAHSAGLIIVSLAGCRVCALPASPITASRRRAPPVVIITSSYPLLPSHPPANPPPILHRLLQQAQAHQVPQLRRAVQCR